MQFSDIMQLRKSGQIDEALHQASDAFKADSDNIWNKRALAWVYYDLMKSASQPENFSVFIDWLSKIRELNLSSDEQMVFDSCARCVSSFIFAMKRAGNIDINRINQLFDFIKDFHFTKPSDTYTFLLKGFHQVHKDWSRYSEFAEWWDLSNFRPVDFEKETFDDKKIMSIGEQVFIAMAKEVLPKNGGNGQPVFEREKAEQFLFKLDQVIEKYPNLTYPPYYKAKLLLALGDNENMLNAFLPFAKRNKQNFWVWQLLGDIYKSETDKRFSCYCRALQCFSPEQMLLNVRTELAAMLVDKGLYQEAKTEIESVIETRKKNDFRIPSQLIEWQKKEWYLKASKLSDNKKLYLLHGPKAEALLYADIEQLVVLISFVNKDKKIGHFIASNDFQGFFKYDRFASDLRTGDLIKVRFKEMKAEGPSYLYSIDKYTESEMFPGLKESFSGTLKVNDKEGFGFVDHVFIPKNIIDKAGIAVSKEVKGQCIRNYDRKKEKWGWVAVSFE